jgi:hypothetical protein
MENEKFILHSFVILTKVRISFICHSDESQNLIRYFRLIKKQDDNKTILLEDMAQA